LFRILIFDIRISVSYSKLFAYCSLVIFLFFISILVLPPAHAALVPCSGLDCKPCHIYAGFSNVINFIVFTLTPGIAVIMILASAIALVFGGSESARTAGKKMLTSVVIGLVIIYTSWLVVNTIIRTLAKRSDGWVPSSWNTIQCSSGSGVDFDRGGQD
jgi:type IV secretory pathway VirB2 component (pilin)